MKSKSIQIKNDWSRCETWLGRSRGLCRTSDACQLSNQHFAALTEVSAQLGNGRGDHHDPVLRVSVVETVSGMRIPRKYKTHKA